MDGDITNVAYDLGVGLMSPVGDTTEITEFHGDLFWLVDKKVDRTPFWVAARNSTKITGQC